jgi:hypothetical protein
MKFLILFLLSFSLFAQLSPEQRRANERVMILKDLAAAHCQQLSGELRQECLDNFKAQIKAALKQSSKKLVADAIQQADKKVNGEIAEENAFAKYTQLLADEGSDNGNCNKSPCLIKKYEKLIADKREAECLASAKAQADSLSVSYLETDSCKQVQKKINDHLRDNAPQASDSQIGGATESQIGG